MRHRFAFGAEIDLLVIAGFQLANQRFDIFYIGLEAGCAKSNQADQVAVGSAGRPVAMLRDEFGGALILTLARSSIEKLDRDDIFEHRLLNIMLVESDIRAPRMTRHRDAAHPRYLIDQFLRGDVDVGEVESLRHFIGDAEDQHVAVIGLDLGRLQYPHAELIFERAIIGIAVPLAMLGEYDSIDRHLSAPHFDPVEVGLYRCAAVFGGFTMRMQIKDSGHESWFLTSPGEISRGSHRG